MEQEQNNQTKRPSLFENKWVRSSGVVALVLILCGGFLYIKMTSSEVSIDDTIISAPNISLSSPVAGTLQDIFVTEGQSVEANQAVARVGSELIKTQVSGVITSVQNNIGASYNAGQAVVTMIDQTQLRAVGTIDENKGLSRIKVGQSVFFTVDAYGSKKYQGVVDEISPMANQQSVVFNISDQRVAQKFNIKVRFNPSDYPELKNGMSAKLTVFTK